MSTGKKVLNVFGIIISLLLSLILVVLLIATPMIMSTLSLLKPQKLADAVSDIDMSVLVEEIAGEALQDLDEEQAKLIGTVLSADGIQQIIHAYTQDTANAILGGEAEPAFTPEMVAQALSGSVDEIVAVLQAEGGEFAQIPKEELTQGVQQFLDENVQELLQQLPDPQQLSEEVTKDSDMAQILQIIDMTGTIKGILIGMIVTLCLLIFVCRLFDWRGFKWLGIDLLIAGVLSAGLCTVVGMSADIIGALAADVPVLEDVIAPMTGALSTGMTVRTVIMVLTAVGCLVVYFLLRKARKQKKAVPQAAVAEPVPAEPAYLPEQPPVAEAEAPAFWENPAQEQPVAEKISSEPAPEEPQV